MSTSAYDVIVLGVGGFGSAACFEVARRGVRVLGLEQFPLGHDRGSSHGETRIIRLAYFEHPDYVPLLRRAYEQWFALEQATKATLLRTTRLLLSGPPEGEAITGALRAAREHHLDVEQLSRDAARRAFPDFVIPAEHTVVVEPDAGFLHVEACVTQLISAARRHGADICDQTPVLQWGRDGSGVFVETTAGRFSAQKLVVTAGAWATQILAELRLPLTVVRKFVGWFAVEPGAYDVTRGCPTYYFENADGAYYGFPSLDGATIKVAEHTGQDALDDAAAVDRSVRSTDVTRLQAFLKENLPRALPKLIRHSVCLYTLTPDRHFIVDRHPTEAAVVLAAGFSGHGFKFVPVIGAALADLALTGRTDLPIDFLGLARPGLQR